MLLQIVEIDNTYAVLIAVSLRLATFRSSAPAKSLSSALAIKSYVLNVALPFVESLNSSTRVVSQPQLGQYRVLRLNAKMRGLHGYTHWANKDVKNAEKYLRRYDHFMNYMTMKEKGNPVGRGVVESACKQILSERMKPSGCVRIVLVPSIMTLYCMIFSGVWETACKNFLATKSTVDDLIQLKAL